MPTMNMARVLEIAKGSATTELESRELADEILHLRETLWACRVAGQRVVAEVTKAMPKYAIGGWRMHQKEKQ